MGPRTATSTLFPYTTLFRSIPKLLLQPVQSGIGCRFGGEFQADPYRLINADCVLLWTDRKSTRLNSSHVRISYAVFCLKKKKSTPHPRSLAPARPAPRSRPP